MDTRTDRRILINLLHNNPGAYPKSLARRAEEALRALELGESNILFRKANLQPKVSSEELELHLRALEFVEYRRSRGRNKESAAREVAAAYGVALDTLISWKKRLRQRFGALAVAQREAFARNARLSRERASGDDSSWEADYGDGALSAAVARYRALKKERKSLKNR